jgi:hypothetical protein
MSPLYLGPRWRIPPFATMLVLLAACFLGGGASRLDVMSLIYLQPLAVICLALFLFTAETIRWSSIKAPLLVIGALAALMTVQLIPLPPDIWTALPGHGRFAASASVVGLEQPWRPFSLTPDLTLASLVSLSVPLAALVGFGALSVEQSRRLLPYLILGAATSALLGLMQFASGGRGALYLFEVTNLGSPVGLFSNRNHQAVLLAMTWPMLALWTMLPAKPEHVAAKRWMAVALALFLLPMTMATGSRAGIILGAAGILVGAALLWQQPRQGRGSRWNSILLAAGVVASVAMIAVAIAFSRAEALQRLVGIEAEQESRLQYLPVLLDIARDFFPVGAGFGSFDPVFRTYEPFELLSPQYLNHAHNDLAEIIIVGGLPAAALVVVFLAWLLRRGAPLLRGTRGRTSLSYGWLGATMLLMLLGHSLADYPLRTPLMAALACLACGWLADSRAGSSSRGEGSDAPKTLYDQSDRP